MVKEGTFGNLQCHSRTQLVLLQKAKYLKDKMKVLSKVFVFVTEGPSRVGLIRDRMWPVDLNPA
jgi:hypothetical protein